MWEVLSFADKPYKGLSKAKVVFSDDSDGGGDDKPYKGFEQCKADYNDYNRDGDVDRKKKGKREIEDEQLHDGASDKLPSTQ